MSDREVRRGARIAASFWIGIEGIDEAPVFRRGNLSSSGIFFESEVPAGPVGSAQFLHMESEDHRAMVQVLARIIRTSEVDDIRTGKGFGIAMEFMPSSEVGRENLERLVRHVVELGLRESRNVAHHYEVERTGCAGERTTLEQLSVHRLVLETDWNAEVGDTLELQIRTPQGSGRYPLTGQVTMVEAHSTGFRVEVQVTGVSAKQNTAVDALSTLIAQPLDDFEFPSRDHLSGLLSRIKLPTLLGLLEMERLSGELEIEQSHRTLCLFLSEGRLVDASGPDTGDIPALMMELLDCREGTFRFSLEDVRREDRVGRSLTALLLDCARSSDEADRDLPPGDFF